MDGAFRRDLGRRIRELRAARGLSQAVLAERAHVTGQYLGQIERGLRDPSLQIACRIATALGVTIDWLAGGNDADEAELHGLVQAMTPSRRKLALRIVQVLGDDEIQPQPRL